MTEMSDVCYLRKPRLFPNLEDKWKCVICQRIARKPVDILMLYPR